MPNVGPIEGWRIAMVARLPILPSASPSPTVVVVLPSPSGVGVIAETTTYLARGLSLSSSIASSLILATSCPYGSSSRSLMPIRSAISGMGLSFALRAMSRSVGNSTFITLSLETRKHLSPPPFGRLDLVEREHVQPRDPAFGQGDLGHHRAEKPARVVAARAEHARDPARVAAQKARRFRDADPGRQPEQPRGVGDARHADVDRQLDASNAHSLDPSVHRVGVEAHVADDVGGEAALVPH